MPQSGLLECEGVKRKATFCKPQRISLKEKENIIIPQAHWNKDCELGAKVFESLKLMLESRVCRSLCEDVGNILYLAPRSRDSRYQGTGTCSLEGGWPLWHIAFPCVGTGM